MIRASGLYGRAVIDLDTAERVGEIDDIIVDPYGPGVAGYVVACDRSFFGSRKRIIIPIDAFHAIGPDALTMRSVGTPEYHTAHLDALPRLSELTGRRMVSFGGRLLGTVEDALVSERDGRIIGYPLERPGPGSWFDSVFGLGWKSERPDYVRADAALRIGARLIVVPDDAIASGDDLEDQAALPDSAGRMRPALAPAPQDPRADGDDGASAPSTEEYVPTAAALRASQARTTPFALADLDVTDEGLGLEPSAERDRDEAEDDARPRFDRPAVDPEQDTGIIAVAGARRERSRRRPQAEKMR
jgi:sporulation protein YlmC with PRC-barrel domain